MSKPVQVLHGRHCRTQTDALKHFKGMLSRHERGNHSTLSRYTGPVGEGWLNVSI